MVFFKCTDFTIGGCQICRSSMTQQPYIHCLVQYAEGFSCWFKPFPLLILVILVLHLFVLLSYWPFSDFSARTLQHVHVKETHYLCQLFSTL